MNLENATAVVTGGGRGIGRSTAVRLAAEGADVVVAARSEDELEEAASAVRDAGSDAIAVPTDVTDTDSVEALFERTRAHFGGVDVLVNNAGTSADEKLWELSDEQWETIIDVNLNGAFRCARAALVGGMLERGTGAIINMSSLSGKIGFANTSAYAASKYGLQGLTNTLAKELRDTEIRVSAVCPGQVATGLTDDIAAVDRMEPEDVADVVVFLATRETNAYVPEVIIVPSDTIPVLSH